jgi:AraC-like DNA-binding protein
MSVSQQPEYFSKQVLRTRRFFIAPQRSSQPSTSSVSWQLTAGGCEWCAPDFIIDRQTFPYAAFEFVARGTGTLCLEGKRHELSAGHAFFYSPTTPHVIESSSNDPLVKYFFNLSGTKAEKLFSDLDLPSGTLLRVLDAARVTMLLEEVIDHALRSTATSIRTAIHALHYALSLCADSRQLPTLKYEPGYSTYLRCRGHLLRNYPVIQSIAQAATHCHITAAYMTRLFKRYDTETPLACLVRLKMSQALIKLRQPEMQVKAVAAELGYQSSAHFSRAFKAWSGMAPQEARLQKD